MSEDEFSEVLERAASLVRDHFALDVRFERGKDYTTAELFEIMPPSVLKVAKSWFYPLPDSFRPPKDFVDWIANVLRGGLVPITVIAKASEAVIPGATEMEIAELASALAEFWFRGVRRWHDLRARDGQRVIDSTSLHQIAMWEYLGYAELPSDILITNQLVAGLRTYAFQPFEAMRGGMMMSETGFSRSGQFAAYSVVSTFPFVNDLGDLNKLGPDPSFDVANATRYTALILAGEIGSLLLRFTINLTNPSCVTFSAPPGQMRAHLDALDPGKYQIGSEPAITPGAFEIRKNRRFLRTLGR